MMGGELLHWLTHMPEFVKPYLAAAFLCENILQEKDNVISAIRIVDVFFTEERYEAVEEEPIPASIARGLLLFRGGPGEFNATIKVIAPDGKEDVVATVNIPLRGGNHSYNVKLIIPVPLNKVGSFQMKVDLEGETLIQIPFEVRRKAESEPQQPQTE